MCKNIFTLIDNAMTECLLKFANERALVHVVLSTNSFIKNNRVFSATRAQICDISNTSYQLFLYLVLPYNAVSTFLFIVSSVR